MKEKKYLFGRKGFTRTPKSLVFGFTLIELLVVIAIIGILSSIVMAVLNVARGKGADAKVKAQLSSAKESAEMFRDGHGSYDGNAGFVAWDCATAGSMFQDVDSGMSQYTNLSNYPALTTMRCSSNGSEYAVSASLGTSGEFWCIDSGGASKQVTAEDHVTAHPDDDTVCH
jgi:prepilin-type N-terminal cleavage/methylation domain-containing protein